MEFWYILVYLINDSICLVSTVSRLRSNSQEIASDALIVESMSIVGFHINHSNLPSRVNHSQQQKRIMTTRLRRSYAYVQCNHRKQASILNKNLIKLERSLFFMYCGFSPRSSLLLQVNQPLQSIPHTQPTSLT